MAYRTRTSVTVEKAEKRNLSLKSIDLVVCGVNALATKVAATQTKPSDLG